MTDEDCVRAKCSDVLDNIRIRWGVKKHIRCDTMELRHPIEVLFFLLHKCIKYYLTPFIYDRNSARYLLIELCVNR